MEGKGAVEATALALLICGMGKGERRSGGGCSGSGGSSSNGERFIILLRLRERLEQWLIRLGFLCG